jgi:glutaredoxin-like protein DUF836
VNTLVLLSKPGCHLCEVMREAILPVLEELGLRLEERDVRGTPETVALYATDIPVLLWGTAVVARGRADAAAVRQRLVELLTAPS